MMKGLEFNIGPLRIGLSNCVSLDMPILTYDKKLTKIQDMKTGEMLFNPKTNSSEMFLGTTVYNSTELVKFIEIDVKQ